MPEKAYTWIPKQSLLTFEEISVLVDHFGALGVERYRLTGGEPLLRKDLPELIRMLTHKQHVRDLSLTTNGVFLAKLAPVLYDAGLHRITLSLDTLDKQRFERISGRDELEAVLTSLDTIQKIGFVGTKLNMVVVRGLNEDEIVPMFEFAKRTKCEIRYIEYMDVGGATRWRAESVVSGKEVLQIISAAHGPVRRLEKNERHPADRFATRDGTVFGIVSSTTKPFCGDCDRSRITADGQWLLCLYARSGIDLRAHLRSGATGREIQTTILSAWKLRQDRGAEERLDLASRGPLYPLEELQESPHLEMHTRGG
jgi:cyclic pyranopterin phosphate synthase